MKEKTRQKFLQQYPEIKRYLHLFSKSKVISSTTNSCFGVYMHSVKLQWNYADGSYESEYFVILG